MGMSKEGLERLAKIVSNIEDCETRQLVGGEVADLCEEETPYFDRNRFFNEACIGDDCQQEETVEEVVEEVEEVALEESEEEA